MSKEIRKALRKYKADFVVLGRPVEEESNKSAFKLASLQAFADEIEEETGASVLIV